MDCSSEERMRSKEEGRVLEVIQFQAGLLQHLATGGFLQLLAELKMASGQGVAAHTVRALPLPDKHLGFSALGDRHGNAHPRHSLPTTRGSHHADGPLVTNGE